jgi:ferredoxin-NADP reductase
MDMSTPLMSMMRGKMNLKRDRKVRLSTCKSGGQRMRFRITGTYERLGGILPKK